MAGLKFSMLNEEPFEIILGETKYETEGITIKRLNTEHYIDVDDSIIGFIVETISTGNKPAFILLIMSIITSYLKEQLRENILSKPLTMWLIEILDILTRDCRAEYITEPRMFIQYEPGTKND